MCTSVLIHSSGICIQDRPERWEVVRQEENSWHWCPLKLNLHLLHQLWVQHQRPQILLVIALLQPSQPLTGNTLILCFLLLSIRECMYQMDFLESSVI